MIREIIDYVDYLRESKPEIFEFDLEPTEGIHVLVNLGPDGKVTDIDYDEFKSGESFKLPRCINLEQHLALVTMNKAVDTKKQIHSASPFAMKIRRDKDLDRIKKRITPYFEKAREMMLADGDVEYQDNGNTYTNEQLIQWSEQFEEFCNTDFWDWFEEQLSEEFEGLAKKKYMFVYLENIPDSIYRQVHENYLKQKLFNKDRYNREDSEGRVYGVSDYLNGLNTKKPYLKHNTAFFEVPGIISDQDTEALFRFDQLKDRGIFPNPMPLFIEKEELNGEVIEIIKDEEERISYRELIRDRLYGQGFEDLGNYYLLYWIYDEIKDVDFVSNFKLGFKKNNQQQKQWNIESLFHGKEKPEPTNIETVFDLETKVLVPLYNNNLVTNTGKGRIWVKYFEELEAKRFDSQQVYQLALETRQAWYDFIYKSRFNAISGSLFNRICMNSIREDIRLDLDANDSNTANIRRKLNIWFSLNEFFDPTNSNFKGNDMPSTLPKLRERFNTVKETEDDTLKDDKEFAYAAGQLVYYLLSRSKSDHLTHAMFDPFLKATNMDQLKRNIERILKQYAYDIHMYAKAFNKIQAEVIGYELEEKSFEDIKSFLIAGYFDNNKLYSDKKESDN